MTRASSAAQRQAQVQARLAALGAQVGTMQAVNERLVISSLVRQAQAERAEQALGEWVSRIGFDPLTQLPTRSLFADRLEQAIANARRRGAHCAVLFFDINGFKLYNDTYGHAFGDAVLCLMAARLTAALREVDTASRHGGDEFVVLLTELAQPGDARAVADKLAAMIAEPAVVDGRPIAMTSSVGVALFPEDGSTVEALVAAADAAMYAGKPRHARSRPAAVHAPRAEDVHALLRAANERLVHTALAAQSRQVQADAARRRQLVRMSALLTRLLAASRQEAGAGVAADRETLDLRAVVAAAVAELQPVAHGRRQVLQWHRPRQALPVHCDALQLQQLLAQLLENACRHSADGASIVVVAEPAGDRVVLSVRDPGRASETPSPDTGCGDSAAAAAEDGAGTDLDAGAFLVGRPADDTGIGPGVGPGVGMTLAQVLAQVHGGSVEAISRGAGQGGELLLTLPRAGAQTARSAG